MMKERLIEIINKEIKSKSWAKELAEKTGISKETIRALASGRQQFSEKYIKAITDTYPQYKMWFVFGETLIENGQISPELEEIRDDLSRTGTDTE